MTVPAAQLPPIPAAMPKTQADWQRLFSTMSRWTNIIPLSQGQVGQILYPQTAAESAAGVTPTNYGYAPDHLADDVRRYGNIDLSGATDCRAILNTANSVGVALYFPPGTYKISTALTLSVNCIFDAGAILKPDASVTVTISKRFLAGDWQIFDLSNSSAAISASVQDTFKAVWFGVKADGTTDDSSAWVAALNTANGRLVHAPAGVSVISSPWSGTTASDIRVRGACPAYIPQNMGFTSGAAYNDLPTNTFINTQEYTIILCNGCNLIGAPDSGTMNGSTKLRSLDDCVVWAESGGGNMGVYPANQPNELVIRNCTFVLFGMWGVLSRSGEYCRYENVAFHDCGWNLAESGSVGATYYSGCGMRFISNFTAGDYHTMNGDDSPTVLKLDRIWFYVRSDTQTNKSGLRGLQLSGVVDAEISKLGGYTGNYYYLSCVSQTGHHIENYATHGFSHTDALPRCLAAYDCDGEILAGYETNFAVSASDPWEIDASGTHGVAWQLNYHRYGIPPVMAGKRLSRLPQNNIILVATPGGTDTFNFPSICDFDTSAISPPGFYGVVTVVLQDGADFTKYTVRSGILGAFRAGDSGWQDIAETNIDNRTTFAGGFTATIALSFSSGDLHVAITWGSSWTVGDPFYLAVGLSGTPTQSV